MPKKIKQTTKVPAENKDDSNIFSLLLENITELEKAETISTVAKIHEKIDEALSDIDLGEKKLRKELTSLQYRFVAAVLADKDGSAEGELKDLLECIIVDPFLGDHHGSKLQKSSQDQSHYVILVHDELKRNIDRDPRSLLKYLRDWHKTLMEQLQKHNFDLQNPKHRSAIKEIISKNKIVLKVREPLNLSSTTINISESKSEINETAEDIFYDVLERSFGVEEYDIDKAISDLERAAKIMEDNPNPNKKILHSDILFRLFFEYKNKGNHDKAFEYVQKSADLGLAKAECYTAIYFLQKKDIQNAIIYFERAGKKGDIYSNFMLGNIYHFGPSFSTTPNDKNTYVEADETKTIKFLKVAANKGHVESNYRLGVTYLQMTPPNFIESIKYFTVSAEEGHAGAHFNLGAINGFAKNPTKEQKIIAIKHFEEALKSFDMGTAQYFHANYYLASLYLSNNSPDKAELCLENLQGLEFHAPSTITKNQLKQVYHDIASTYCAQFKTNKKLFGEKAIKYAKKAVEYGDSSPEIENVFIEFNYEKARLECEKQNPNAQINFAYWVKKSIKFFEDNPNIESQISSTILKTHGVRVIDDRRKIVKDNLQAGMGEFFNYAGRIIEAENLLKTILKLSEQSEEKAKALLSIDGSKNYKESIAILTKHLTDPNLNVQVIENNDFKLLIEKVSHLMVGGKESKGENKDKLKESAVPKSTPARSSKPAVTIHTGAQLPKDKER